jgi:DNA replication protein DnaC
MSEDKVCPLCGGLGFILTPSGAKRCKCLYESFDIGRFLNIPKRFRGARLKDLKGKIPSSTLEALKFYLKNFPDFYKKGVGLLLVGPTGVGKTYTVCAVLKYIYERYRIRGHFVDTKELSLRLKASFSENGSAQLVESLIKYPILVLDDLGNEVLTDWYREILTGIISSRYNESRPTFITTNFYPGFLLARENPAGGFLVKRGRKSVEVFPKKEENLLENRIGAHLVSRLAEMSYPLTFWGNDKRLESLTL